MVLFQSMAIMIVFPYIALIPGIIFLVLYSIRVKHSSLVAVMLWGGYFIYELLMYFRIICTSECNIRLDLMLIYPVLLVMTLVATILFFVRGKPKES